MQEFSFTINESLALCYRVLSKATGRDLDNWTTLTRKYKANKAPLIRAINPETGRITRSIETSRSDQDTVSAWEHNLTPSTVRLTYDQRYSDLLEKLATIDRVPEDSRETVRARTQKQIDAIRALAPILLGDEFSVALRQFRDYLDSATVVAGAISPTGRLAHDFKEICRPGMKLSRALASFLAQLGGLSADHAAQVVDTIVSAVGDGKYTRQAVLSVNPLDILLSSELSTWSSCHRLEGEYRAGNLSYIVDDVTAVCYLHDPAVTKPSKQKSLGLSAEVTFPFKTARKIVYFDRARRGAVMMRIYGNTGGGDVVDKLWRELVAGTLARLSGATAPEGEADDETEAVGVKWYWWPKYGHNHSINNPSSLPYIDEPTGSVQLARGAAGRPAITLATSVPCPNCGGVLDNAAHLVCEDCEGGRGRYRCCSCNDRVDEEDSRCSDSGDCYCEDCYHENYSSCSRCGCEMSADDGQTHNGDTYCEHCFNRNYFACHSCDATGRQSAGYCPDDEWYCESCYMDNFSTCEGCNEPFTNDDVTRTDNGPFCADCLPKPEADDETEPAPESAPCSCHNHEHTAQRIQTILTTETNIEESSNV